MMGSIMSRSATATAKPAAPSAMRVVAWSIPAATNTSTVAAPTANGRASARTASPGVARPHGSAGPMPIRNVMAMPMGTAKSSKNGPPTETLIPRKASASSG